ncbi:MAG: phage terminase large subunit family protein [Prolixibacteraceae bacterium]|jgi:phage terminase large subunit GpA-like protein|nr:phage terminase large subunit family protein [Prolixibacteraceae bacterium]
MISEDNIQKTFCNIFGRLDFSDKSMLPSEFAEKHIVLDSSISTLKQGRFSYDITPYLKEVVDCTSPYHPARIIAVMKAAQIGYSQGVIVPAIVWKIANDPGNIVSLSANADLSKRFVEGRLDPVIQRCFVKDLIRPSVIRKRNARTGDTSASKEFAGGSATFGGLQSFDKMGKQMSYALGFYDDWEGAKIADKDQGNTFELLQQRFSSSANTMKQFFISTPEVRPSNIENLYLMGDQRKWHIPCPVCGEYIELLWSEEIDGERVGIVFDTHDNGKLIPETVRYKCQKCSGEFKEKHKYRINLKGKWIPTAEPIEEGFYSYKINALCSAPGMYDWTAYAYRWCRIFMNNEKGDVGKLKVFKNLVLGEPWEEKRITINETNLMSHTRGYEVGVVPSKLSEQDGNGKVILLTMAADMNGTEYDARLDWEVMAHSVTGSVYSVDHGSIGTYQPGQKSKELKNKGERDLWSYHEEDDLNVWGYLESEIMNRKFFTDDGREMEISQVMLDSGYMTQIVYAFVEKYPELCLAVKGKDKDKYTKPTQDMKLFKVSREHPLMYLLEVDKIKDMLSNMLNLDWNFNADSPQPYGYVNYPTPNYQESKYTIDYFKQLAVEDKEFQVDEQTGETSGWKWINSKKKANHFWDCEVYNIAAREVFMYNFIREYNKIEKLNIEVTWYNFSRIILDLFNL